jgi:oligogalacturonide lyase
MTPAGCSRRLFVVSLAAACRAVGSGAGAILPPAAERYADPATEFPVLRLTDPAFSSYLPVNASHSISRRGNFLLYASDVSGRMEVYRMDTKKGEARQLTDAAALEPGALTMLQDERGFLYLDGAHLMAQLFSAAWPRQVYTVPDGFEHTPGLSASIDGLYCALVERKGASHRLRLVNLRTGEATTLAEADEPILAPLPRPKRASVLYLRAGGVWLANYDGKQNYRLRLADESVQQALWSPDGRTVLYLIVPAEAGRLNSIREFVPDTNQDRAVADTTQFLRFGANADASVFVGVSGSKATPYVFLLVRRVKRELTLCEYHASDPAMATPLFSANSQQIYFTGDMHGKPAIYRMDVNKFVEETAEPPL